MIRCGTTRPSRRIRDWLLAGDVAAEFLATLLERPKVRRLLSSEHFSVDGTLIQAWASIKSFQPQDDVSGPPDDAGRNGSRDFHRERRRNQTHASTTDPTAKLFRKGPGKEAKLSFMGHLLMENRSGLVIGAQLTAATGHAERDAATALIAAVPGRHRITVWADRRLRCGELRGRLAGSERDAARCAESRRPTLTDRSQDRAPRGLPDEPARAQTDRGGVRVGQDDRWPGPDPVPRHRPSGLGVHACRGSLQPDPVAQAATAPS